MPTPKDSNIGYRLKELKPAELAFVRAYVEFPNIKNASILAGIKPETGRVWLRRPLIVTAIDTETRRRLASLAPVALAVIKDMLISPGTTDNTRASLARWVVEQQVGRAPEAERPPASEQEIVEGIKDLAEELGVVVDLGEEEYKEEEKEEGPENFLLDKAMPPTEYGDLDYVPTDFSYVKNKDAKVTPEDVRKALGRPDSGGSGSGVEAGEEGEA